MARISVIGAGYVGLTCAVCFAHLGHSVSCAELDPGRVQQLQHGELPIVEEGMAELLREGLAAGRLRFTTDSGDAVAGADVTFLCVPTPEGPDGRADMSFIEAAAQAIGRHLKFESVVVNKSTVPVGSTKVVERALGRADVSVVSNPEFLREGSAVHDFLNPARIVIGAENEAVAIKVAGLFLRTSAPLVVTDPATAETIKYAANAFLATKISFINAVAALCESVGADVGHVALGMGLDPRIGSDFLRAGPGWGGSCFPKDTRALIAIAEDAGYDFSLIKGVIAVNEEQYERVVAKAARLAGGSLRGRVVALWGLTFKARTDDMRDSPAREIARRLVDEGATVQAYDPTVRAPVEGLTIYDDAYSACEGASLVVIATEWDEFRWLDLDKVGQLMERRAIVDARNLLEPAAVRRYGFAYEGIGRP